jgi:hypothetical protein
MFDDYRRLKMDVMQHTPGPWALVVEDGDMKIVAPPQEPRLATRETLMCDTQYYPWCPSNEADWKLIAAAPELLHALRAVMFAPDEQKNIEAASALLVRIGAA